MSSETFSGDDSRNSLRHLGQDAARDFRNAEVLGLYEQVRVGQSFELIVRNHLPRYVERPYGVWPRIEDRGEQRPFVSYLLYRVSDEPDAPCQWFMQASDAERMPVELYGSATADGTLRREGVILRGMRFICNEVGIAIPDAMGPEGEISGDTNIYLLDKEDRKTYMLGPVVDVTWPNSQGTMDGPIAGGAAEN